MQKNYEHAGKILMGLRHILNDVEKGTGQLEKKVKRTYVSKEDKSKRTYEHVDD